MNNIEIWKDIPRYKGLYQASNEGRINFQAASEKRRRKRRTDELRKLSGLPQKTRFRFSTLPAKTVKTIWRMVNKHNYFQMEGKRLVLYYDNSTRRTNAEKYLTKKYGLRFVSY